MQTYAQAAHYTTLGMRRSNSGLFRRITAQKYEGTPAMRRQCLLNWESKL